jgi:cupin fold WbuC family metalloprotein
MDRPEIIRISPAATRSCHEAVAFIDRDLVQRKAYDARRSLRRRDIHVFHRGDDDPLQRMLNAIQPGSYIRPHRHLDPPKSESVILLQGMLGYVSFRDDGTPEDDNSLLLDLDRGVLGCDIRPGVWHTIFALAPDTVVFEVKPGPYSAANDKDFAPWAPEEFIPVSREQSLPAPGRSLAPAAFLAEIEDGFRRLWGLPPRSWQLPVTDAP